MSAARIRLPAASRARVAAAAAAALAVAVAVGGCATVPTSGPVQQVGVSQVGVSQEQDYSQPIPVGPGPGWSPAEIVAGFLAASASFAGDHQVAREYLDPTAQQHWRPGWAVTVVSGSLTTSPAPPLPRPVSNQSELLARVKATGQPVATLTGSGQYLVSSGSSSTSSYFSLIKENGQWRIDALPRSQLLLTQADFQRVYQPRNLYFLTQSGRTLVPDPVFVPQQATNTELAAGLVHALLQVPNGWLYGAAATGFPAKAKPTVQVRINGSNAVVDLGGKAVPAGRRQLMQMAAQLVWTLTSGPTSIQSVELEINGRPVQVNGSQIQLPQTYHDWVPAQTATSSLYYIGGNGTVQAVSGSSAPAAVPGQAGTAGVPPFSSIAVSPDERELAGLTTGGGAVYIGNLAHGAGLREWKPENGVVTSVSWDAQGDLWAAAGGTVWILPPISSAPISAAPITMSVALGNEVTDFQVAPDGVRVAMIVNSTVDGKSRTQVQLAAITHSGTSSSIGDLVTLGASIPDPESVTWYGAGDLIVLAKNASGTQLYDVPLNGGQPTQIPAAGDDPVSVTALNPQNSAPQIAIGLPGGKVMISTGTGAFEPTRAVGEAPAYPG
jgi:hypothetical protein